MATLRLLFSLSIVILGAVLAGLAISGYYEPGVSEGPASASAHASHTSAELQYVALQDRFRFVAPAEEKAPPSLVRPKPAAKPKAPVRERSEAKPSRPRQAAAPWPWSLFGN